MRSQRQFSVIDLHSAGAPARVVVGGAPFVRGDTVREKRERYLELHDDIRKFLMYEPRGHSEMCGSILIEPCNPEADFGIVFIETGGWVEMCGAGTIAAATAVVETGMIPVIEPITKVVFDTPVGIVTAEVEVSKGVVQRAQIRNVPSYLEYTDQRIEVEGHGEILVDVAFGGNHYALVDAADFGLSVSPQHSSALAEVGRRVRGAVNEQLELRSPIDGSEFSIPMVLICDPVSERADAANRVLVFFGESGIDRSPGGTGTSARMAQRFGRGLMTASDIYVQESIIGSRFVGSIDQVTSIGEVQAITPVISGRAFITGFTTFVLDPEDPFPEGFGVGYASDAVARNASSGLGGE